MTAFPFELQSQRHPRTSIELILGFFATLAMVLLGLVWPSYFSLVALVVSPAPVLFIVAMLKRELLVQRFVRIYLRTCVYISLICWVYYVWFILTKTQPA